MDKKILTQSVGKPIVYAFYSTIISLVAVVAYPWAKNFNYSDWKWAAVAGIMFGFGLWALFIAIQKSEVSHIGPFNGAFLTVLLYIFSAIFLGERLSTNASAGVFLLVSASLILSFEYSRKHTGVHLGFAWAILSALCFAISQTAMKYLYIHYDFIAVFVRVSIMTGFFGVACVFSRDVRLALSSCFSRKKFNPNPRTKHSASALALIVADKTFAFAAVLCVQYAVYLGSVTLVNALSGLQFIFMFIIVLLFTKLAPRVFNEYVTKREVVMQTFAIFLIAAGLVFLVV